MKNFKNTLHLLITAASLLGFLGGWATLAHSRKPQTVQPLQPLAPLPALNSPTNASSANSGLFGLFSTAPARRTRTRSVFTTSGS